VLALLMLAGLTGLLDTHTRTTGDEAGGWELEVDYPWMTRAGQLAPLHIRVRHPGGFPNQTVAVELCDDLFDALDYQNWYPNPAAETGSDGRVIYEFDTPPGDLLEVSLDARTGPGELGGHDTCRIAVLEKDEAVVSVQFDNWRLP
jgi:hypothetical protein